MAREIESCKDPHLTGEPQQLDIVFIGWKRPQEKCIKLNYDSTHKIFDQSFRVYDLLWDNNRKYVISYVR